MDTLTNAIIVMVQKTLNAETNANDAQIIRNITRNIKDLPAGKKKVILMTMQPEQICKVYGN